MVRYTHNGESTPATWLQPEDTTWPDRVKLEWLRIMARLWVDHPAVEIHAVNYTDGHPGDGGYQYPRNRAFTVTCKLDPAARVTVMSADLGPYVDPETLNAPGGAA